MWVQLINNKEKNLYFKKHTPNVGLFNKLATQ